MDKKKKRTILIKQHHNVKAKSKLRCINKKRFKSNNKTKICKVHVLTKNIKKSMHHIYCDVIDLKLKNSLIPLSKSSTVTITKSIYKFQKSNLLNINEISELNSSDFHQIITNSLFTCILCDLKVSLICKVETEKCSHEVCLDCISSFYKNIISLDYLKDYYFIILEISNKQPINKNKIISNIIRSTTEHDYSNYILELKCPLISCKEHLTDKYFNYLNHLWANNIEFLKTLDALVVNRLYLNKDNCIEKLENSNNILILNKNISLFNLKSRIKSGILKESNMKTMIFTQKENRNTICCFCNNHSLINNIGRHYYKCLYCLKRICKYCYKEFSIQHLKKYSFDVCKMFFRYNMNDQENGSNEIKSNCLSILYGILVYLIGFLMMHIGLFSISFSKINKELTREGKIGLMLFPVKIISIIILIALSISSIVYSLIFFTIVNNFIIM